MKSGEKSSVLVGVAAGVVLGWLIATAPAVLAGIPWFDAIAAVGSCGAALTALWLANRDSRRRDREALLTARLEAARIYLRLARLVTQTEAVAAWFWDILNGKTPEAAHSAVITRLELMQKDFGDVDLKALVPLANDCALNLAKWLGTVEFHIERQKQEASLYRGVVLPNRQNQAMLSHGNLLAAAAHIRAAWLECQTAGLGLQAAQLS